MYSFLSDYFVNTTGFLHLFSYITSRCGFAFFLSFLLVLFFMPKYISFSHKWQIAGQPIRENYLPEHANKKGTPTMGGIMIVLMTIFCTFLFGDLKNVYILILIGSLFFFSLIGVLDDYTKIYKKDVGGIKGKVKIIFQLIFGLIAILVANKYVNSVFYTNYLTFPFFKKLVLDLGIFYTIFRLLVIVGSSNAINITDGLDGLAIVPTIIVNAVFLVFAYIIGNIIYSKYLFFNYQNGAQEICIFLSALIGSSVGFLWYNIKPAQIFMGDTGSLAIGGVIGVTAVLLKCEFILAIAGGLFVIEAMSVILQVGYFKITKGKRLFRMSPIHHHFEKKGWSEMQVVVRFWIIAAIFGFIAILSLKVR